MPQMLHTDSVNATRSTDEQHLELLCADEDLVRAEFDAIITAQWPGPPPAEPDRGADAEPDPRRVQHRPETGDALPPSRPRHPGIGGWTRQRSPPARGSHNRRQEGE